jgi:hypothetical protein
MTTASPERSKPDESESASTLEKVLHWLIFGVVISLAPFAAVIFDDLDQGVKLTLPNLFGHGELLIVSAIIAAGGIGEIFSSASDARKVPKLIVLGCCVVILITTSIWFADASSVVTQNHLSGSGRVIHPKIVAYGSVAIFIFTIIASGSALTLSKSAKGSSRVLSEGGEEGS